MRIVFRRPTLALFLLFLPLLLLSQQPPEPAPLAWLEHGPWLSYPDVGAISVGFVTGGGRVGAGVDYRRRDSEEDWQRVWDSRGGQLQNQQPQHLIRLQGLTPGETYEYRIVLVNPTKKQFNDRSFPKEREFRAPQLTLLADDRFHFQVFDNAPGDYSFAFTADLQFSNDVRKRMLTNYHERGDMAKSRFYVILGDALNDINVFERDYVAGVIKHAVGLGASSQPWLFVRGNHEWRGLDAPRWLDFLPAPTGKSFFSFRCGDAYYIVLDSGEDRPAAAMTHHFSGNNVTEMAYLTEQRDWLAELVTHKEFLDAKYRIVLCHSAPCTHNGKFMTQNLEMIVGEQFKGREPRHRIHLWLAGHTHFYSRSVPCSNEFYAFVAPQRKLYSGSDYAFPVVTTDGPGFAGTLDTSCISVAVSADKLSVTARDEQGAVFDRCDILPDGSVVDIPDAMLVKRFTYTPAP
ncbi:MAG: hypothetical protein GX945_05815 [Lentisphaerae bacterium]|jgi:hypothetical protein|nr:hypothetical protein [Lentisphaerota bacterium]